MEDERKAKIKILRHGARMRTRFDKRALLREADSFRNILFLCCGSGHRSQTAESLFQNANAHLDCRSASIAKDKGHLDKNVKRMIEWAEQIIIFDKIHLEMLVKYYGSDFFYNVKIVDIEDKYQPFEKELFILLMQKCQWLLR